jgi:hypothetical protein
VRLVIRCCVSLLTFTTALIAGVLIVGKLQPDTNMLHELGFELCSGKPCFMGIIPGETPWETIEQLLQAHGADYRIDNRSDTGRAYVQVSGWLVHLQPSFGLRDVQQIFVVSRHGLPYAPFLLLYGEPCYRGRQEMPMPIWQVNFRNIILYVSDSPHVIRAATSTVSYAQLSVFISPGCERLALP